MTDRASPTLIAAVARAICRAGAPLGTDPARAEDGWELDIPAAHAAIEVVWAQAWREGAEAAAKITEAGAAKLIEGKRPNQVDRHVHWLLTDRAAAIRALSPMGGK